MGAQPLLIYHLMIFVLDSESQTQWDKWVLTHLSHCGWLSSR